MGECQTPMIALGHRKKGESVNKSKALISRLVRANLCVVCAKAHGNALIGERIVCANCHYQEVWA